MKNIIDEKIIDLAKKSELEIPQDYDTGIDCLLDSLEDEKKTEKLIPLRRAIAMAAVFTLTFSIGVYAVVNYVRQRMEAMDSGEKGGYVEGLQTSPANFDNCSRALTESEEIRLEQLKKEYQNQGKFPEGKLVEVDSANAVPDDTLCFVAETSTFYFPEREMTDEELLEFIDFKYKRDYSLMEAPLERLKEGVATESTVDEAKILNIAKQLLWDVYDIDIKDSDYIMTYINHQAEMMNDMYEVEVVKDQTSYVICLDAKSGSLVHIKCLDISDNTSEIMVDEQQYIENYAEIQKALTKIAPEETIKKCYLEYMYDDNNILHDGDSLYYIEMESGVNYILTYNYAKHLLESTTYVESNTILKTVMQSNAGVSETSGLTYQIIELQ